MGRIDSRDVVIIAGVAILLLGCWFVDWRLTLIVLGGLMTVVGLASVWRGEA